MGPEELLCSTKEKENFQRLVRLLISGGTSLLRQIFDQIYPPGHLPKILSNPATVKQLKAARLTKPQWDCLYPSPGVYGKSADFDVTLLFRLLRTICNLTPPATGWDALPVTTDHSLAADLARIKYYRNSVYGHVHQNMEITDDEFPLLWHEISGALLGIAGQINPLNKDKWQKAINTLLTDPLTKEDERNVEELLRWYRNDTEVKEYLEKLNSSVKTGMEHLETSIQEGLQITTRAIEEKSQHLETAVQEEAQSIKDQLGGEVQFLRQEFREEAQSMKDQMGGMRESIDRLGSSADSLQTAGVQLRMRIDCEAIPAACPRVGTSGTMVLDTHGSQTGDQEMVVSGVKSKAVEPVTSYQPQAGVTGDFETANVGSDGIPSAQQVLNLIAVTFLKRDDMSDTEKSNGFIDYMEGARKVLIVDTQPGSLVITVECGSLKILDDLWDDYRTGHLHEMAQKYLVTDDILKTFGLVEVKLKTTIEEKDYRAAREYFLEALGNKSITRYGEELREECPHEVAPKDRPYDLKPDEGEEEIWEEISQTLVRIAGEVSPVRKTEWQEAIEKFLKAPLTTQDEKDIQKIPCWYRNDLVVNKSIEDLKSSFQEVQCGIEHLETSFEGVQAGLQGTSRVKESIENLKSSIQKVQHAIENLKTSDKGVQAWLQETIHIMDKGQYLETEVREEAEGIKDPEALNRPIISLGSLDKENPNFIWIFQTNIARWEGEGSPILRTMFQHFV